MLAYDIDQFGMVPTPFAGPMATFRVDAVAATFAMFIALLASVDVGLQVGFKDELERLNTVFHQVWTEAAK